MASVGSPGWVGSFGCSDRSSSMSRNGISFSVLVEATFFRVWSKWPLAVATALGVCLRKDSGVRDGQLRIHPLSSAFYNVDGTGENKAAWANLIRSGKVVLIVVRLSCSMVEHACS